MYFSFCGAFSAETALVTHEFGKGSGITLQVGSSSGFGEQGVIDSSIYVERRVYGKRFFVRRQFVS